ncbi:hypothetical protein D9758_005049 [Tetrapyrgos nigripes]|uniref:NAD-dependent epimerase/dehydratase domain-containing protein n=1 Tax=Tetrapyrgos nigripes TaxID=182062 RepID=A0A8H5GWF5_9AGAR|nr:hypothetical protein D9758_005049 [Tetrapyrgos nigripes]
MKVLILGATGYIGFPVAQALCRAGHIVYGQTRSEEKAPKLAAEEIYPIIGEPNSSAWHHLVPTLDVIIQAIGGRNPEISKEIFQSIVSLSSDTSLRPPGSPKLTFIYTSGIAVHGAYRDEIISDTTPIVVAKSGELAKGHAAQEQAVRENQVFNGIVIRPGFVFGRSMEGSAFGPMLFAQAKAGKGGGKVSFPGKPGGHLPVVHQDDLADLYVRVAEKALLIGGLALDGVNDITESTEGVLQRFIEVSGMKGPVEYREPQHMFDVAPRKIGFADGMHLYYNAYLANTQKQS